MIMHDLFGMFKCEANKQAAYCSVHETVAAADTCRIADIALGKHPQARAADELRAGEFLLAIAGVRASDVASQEPLKEIMSAPVNVSVVIGAMPAADPDVIDGESRVLE